MTHAFCFFYSVVRWVKRGTSIALAPKKTVAHQARWGPPPDVAPILGKSGASIIASSAGLAPTMVVPMPSVGQAIGEAEEEPLEVAAQPATEVTPTPTLERAVLSAAPIASTTVGAAQSDEGLPAKVEVMVAMMEGS